MNIAVNFLVAAAMLTGAFLFVAEDADARGFGKLIARGISGTSVRAGARAHDGGAVLSKSQLRDCLRLQSDMESAELDLTVLQPIIDVYDGDIAELEKQIDRMDAEIESMSRRIEASAPLVNTHSQYSVNNHNALVDAYNAAVQQRQTAVAGINAVVDRRNAKASEHRQKLNAYKPLVEKFNKQCAHSYRVSDMDAILAEKESEARQ